MARKKEETLVLFRDVQSITRKFSDEQFGVLIRAAFSYRFNGEIYSGDDVAVDVAFQAVANQIDRYNEFCGKQSNNAKSGAAKPNRARGSQIQPKDTPLLSSPIQSRPSPIQEGVQADKLPAPARRKFGTYGWVKLSEDEHSRLVEDLGEAETNRCISYVDESAQSTGNRNKWRDWNLVIRKCSRERWGAKTTNSAQPARSTADRYWEMLEGGEFRDH